MKGQNAIEGTRETKKKLGLSWGSLSPKEDGGDRAFLGSERAGGRAEGRENGRVNQGAFLLKVGLVQRR